MENIILMFKNWKTTVIGIVPLLAALLGALGIISFTPEEATAAVGTSFDAIIEILLAAVGLIGLFAKDGDKSSESLGIKSKTKA